MANGFNELNDPMDQKRAFSKNRSQPKRQVTKRHA